MPKPKKIAAAVAIPAVAVLGAFGILRMAGETKAEAKAKFKAVRKELRAAPADEISARLRALADDHSVLVKRTDSFPWVSIGYGPKIPYDSIGLLAEEAFLKLTGDVKSPKEDTVRRIKDLLAGTKHILDTGKLSAPAANSLSERRLDGFFLAGDYDGAIALLEKEGMPGRTEGWCKSTAAKLRAHKAMEAGERKEAVKQLLVFIDYMLSSEMADFEDCDPANGVTYSREWVAAKNYMRCRDLAKADGDAAGASGFEAKAKPLYKAALEKAKDDKVSFDELEKEMKSCGM